MLNCCLWFFLFEDVDADVCGGGSGVKQVRKSLLLL